MTRTLAIFARWPEPGRVKTRLSPALPPDLACGLQRAMLADTLAAARAAEAGRRVICWDGAPRDGPASLGDAAGFETLDQSAGDLGARLTAAMEGLRRNPRDRVIVSGSDAPEIAAATFDAAFSALESHGAVFGPAHDGGFTLVGLSRSAPTLFEAIDWSTEHALAQVRSRAEGLGLDPVSLEPLADVDTPADLVGLIARLLGRRGGAPRTAACLAEIGILPPR